jgi:endoglycosylceramidase
MRVLLVAVALVLGAPATAAAAEPPQHQLRRDETFVVDEHGRVVLLHGVNVVWKAAPYVPPNQPGGLTDVDLARIAGHGWNVVRLGVTFEGIMPAKGVVDHAHLAAIESVVDRITAHGMYVLLDLHQDLMGKPWGNGFPAWAIHHRPELEALEPDLGFPLNATRPSHNLAWDDFWADRRLAPGDPQGPVGYLADAIGALVERLGDHPGLAGLEIINEAWAGTPILTCIAVLPAGCPLVDMYVQATWERITDHIRQIAPDLLVWWEPPSTWNLTAPSHFAEPPLTPAIDDPQVAFAFHDYCGFGELSTYFGSPPELQQTCDVQHAITWRNAAAVYRRTGLPQLMTEFGNIDNGVEIERALRLADAAFTGWQYWHYGAGFALRPASTEPFSPDQLRHLSRTYPAATAGTPVDLSFDPATGEMRYSYVPRDLGAPTEIALSDVHYPRGYDVAVTGGHVADTSSTGRVLIDADAGAQLVEVVVRAKTADTAASAIDRPRGGELPATGGSVPPSSWLVLALAVLAVLGKLIERTVR